ncbi:hypothetical protein AKUA1404_10040 [Apilactobacillus kunkeei]|uniref:Uncharacterized protein n=1 Tax=Apilactobacillus nanyangensis TaxID=2799579 RepID=A0ABT0HWZ0_9LACO|nr:hypothetical protein [Apilactobacillus nanyangensis]MCK8611141.1 hypothetical protein [Apilactobacillus nanyangensis]TMT02484.1 hypothetical protein FD687_02055 [Apilactobacillus kunkeei]TMT03350.1 hypothetical protein FD689_05420 [Apilactobacillus kunkeei]CAI2684935.1 hypothetical protein AKUA1404_10040 [Apilactobacillus kunkeei]
MITRKEYQNSQKRNNIDDDFIKRDEPVEEPTFSRSQPDEKQGNEHAMTPEQKTKRLGRRLNWAIVFLILAIIVVYLILIYVNP